MKKAARPPADLTPLELQRKISIQESARLNDVSAGTFRRHYSHLIRKVGLRRDVVTLRDAITLPPVAHQKKER
jgi:hypothetical protein